MAKHHSQFRAKLNDIARAHRLPFTLLCDKIVSTSLQPYLTVLAHMFVLFSFYDNNITPF